MFTIRAMARVGPWTVTAIERAPDRMKCERCGTPIKWIYHCSVDADAPALGVLGGKQDWRVGSECGPMLEGASEGLWHERMRDAERRKRLAIDLERAVAHARATGAEPPTLLEERRESLHDGTIDRRRLGHLSHVIRANLPRKK